MMIIKLLLLIMTNYNYYDNSNCFFVHVSLLTEGQVSVRLRDVLVSVFAMELIVH